jgi:hypothetical protein
MHAFAGATHILFGPAPTTGLGLFPVEELFTQSLHVLGVSDIFKRHVAQPALAVVIIHNFIVGQAARTHSAHRASLKTDPRQNTEFIVRYFHG